MNTEIPTNIIDQISSYNSNDLENYIYNLNNQLKEQLTINKLLKSEDYKKNISDITNFIERNESEIDDQSNRLNEIIKELKDVINSNKNLEKLEDKYDDLLNSEDANRVANKLRDIKKMKEDIKFFLIDSGLIIN
tara:strand:+ start:579 stop:983 length:405 start_codon:yes stop_codon:yes gene_type:complete